MIKPLPIFSQTNSDTYFLNGNDQNKVGAKHLSARLTGAVAGARLAGGSSAASRRDSGERSSAHLRAQIENVLTGAASFSVVLSAVADVETVICHLSYATRAF